MTVLVFVMLMIVLDIAAWRWGADSRDRTYSLGAVLRPRRRVGGVRS